MKTRTTYVITKQKEKKRKEKKIINTITKRNETKIRNQKNNLMHTLHIRKKLLQLEHQYIGVCGKWRLWGGDMCEKRGEVFVWTFTLTLRYLTF